MAAVIVLCLCSSLSSSAVAGSFFGGVIPNTAPHYLKKIKAGDFKNAMIPLSGDLEKFTNEIYDLKTNNYRKGVTSNQAANFIKNIDKKKCENLVNASKNMFSLAKEQDNTNPVDEVFSLQGFASKDKVVMNFLELPEENIKTMSFMCEKRLKMN